MNFFPSTVLIILSIIFISIGFFIGSLDNDIQENGIQTTATVQSIIKVNNGDHFNWYPVLKYKVGTEYLEQRYQIGNAQPFYTVGQEILITYNAKEPETFMIENQCGVDSIQYIFIGIGILLDLIGALLIVFNYKTKNKIKQQKERNPFLLE